MTMLLRSTVVSILINMLMPIGSTLHCEALSDSSQYVLQVIHGPRHHAPDYPIGLRDPIALALQFGTFSGLSADVRFLRFSDFGVAAEAAGGISISVWGLGIGWNADLRFDLVESDDKENDAFLLEPSVGYGRMLAIGGAHGWDDFFRDVTSINVFCGAAWVHEFDFGVASDISLRPGMYFAIQKEANSEQSTLSSRAFHLILATSIRF